MRESESEWVSVCVCVCVRARARVHNMINKVMAIGWANVRTCLNVESLHLLLQYQLFNDAKYFQNEKIV